MSAASLFSLTQIASLLSGWMTVPSDNSTLANSGDNTFFHLVEQASQLEQRVSEDNTIPETEKNKEPLTSCEEQSLESWTIVAPFAGPLTVPVPANLPAESIIEPALSKDRNDSMKRSSDERDQSTAQQAETLPDPAVSPLESRNLASLIVRRSIRPAPRNLQMMAASAESAVRTMRSVAAVACAGNTADIRPEHPLSDVTVSTRLDRDQSDSFLNTNLIGSGTSTLGMQAERVAEPGPCVGVAPVATTVQEPTPQALGQVRLSTEDANIIPYSDQRSYRSLIRPFTRDEVASQKPPVRDKEVVSVCYTALQDRATPVPPETAPTARVSFTPSSEAPGQDHAEPLAANDCLHSQHLASSLVTTTLPETDDARIAARQDAPVVFRAVIARESQIDVPVTVDASRMDGSIAAAQRTKGTERSISIAPLEMEHAPEKENRPARASADQTAGSPREEKPASLKTTAVAAEPNRFERHERALGYATITELSVDHRLQSTESTTAHPPEPTVTRVWAPEKPSSRVGRSSVREVVIRLDGGGSKTPVEVRIVEKAGRVNVTVRAADTPLNNSIREHLNELVQKIEDHGLKIETWTPPDTSPGHHTAIGSPALTQHDLTSDPQGQGGGQNQEQQPEQRRKQDSDGWIELLTELEQDNED